MEKERERERWRKRESDREKGRDLGEEFRAEFLRRGGHHVEDHVLHQVKSSREYFKVVVST